MTVTSVAVTATMHAQSCASPVNRGGGVAPGRTKADRQTNQQVIVGIQSGRAGCDRQAEAAPQAPLRVVAITDIAAAPKLTQ